jgi:hypothetical protein
MIVLKILEKLSEIPSKQYISALQADKAHLLVELSLLLSKP